MVKKVVFHCKSCNYSTRADSRRQALNRIRDHAWKEHKNSMNRKINDAKRRSAHNPSLQDFAAALVRGPREALAVYGRMAEWQYQHMKRVLDAFEPLMSPEIKTAWRTTEALHDALHPPKKQ